MWEESKFLLATSFYECLNCASESLVLHGIWKAQGKPTVTRLLDFLVESFVAGFGITHPRPEQQGLVRLLLGGFLLGAIVLVVGVVVFFWIQIH